MQNALIGSPYPFSGKSPPPGKSRLSTVNDNIMYRPTYKQYNCQVIYSYENAGQLVTEQVEQDVERRGRSRSRQSGTTNI